MTTGLAANHAAKIKNADNAFTFDNVVAFDNADDAFAFDNIFAFDNALVFGINHAFMQHFDHAWRGRNCPCI